MTDDFYKKIKVKEKILVITIIMIMVAFGLDMKLIKKLGIKEILEFKALL